MFGYVELYNVVCACVILDENYTGKPIDFVFYQDALTGEKTTPEPFNINLDLISQDQKTNEFGSFEILINSLFERLRYKEFNKILEEETKTIADNYISDSDLGKIKKEDVGNLTVKAICTFVAELLVFQFPYMVDDFKDWENDDINYIHSNLREDQTEEFSDKYKQLQGIPVTFQSTSDIFIIKDFHFQPFLEKEGTKLFKTYCCLENGLNGRKKYIPYREFFEGLVPPNQAQENKVS